MTAVWQEITLVSVITKTIHMKDAPVISITDRHGAPSRKCLFTGRLPTMSCSRLIGIPVKEILASGMPELLRYKQPPMLCRSQSIIHSSS